MIRREASSHLTYMAKIYPVLTIAGPRHAGKTTLAKAIFPQHQYVNLETPETREHLRRRFQEFFKRYSAPLIIDEYLRAPELLPYIRAAIRAALLCNKRGGGQFILITSRLPQPRAGFLRPLVINAATHILLPLTISELDVACVKLNRDEYIYKGFMPRVYNENADSARIYRNYLAYFINHDAPRLAGIDNKAAFWRFMRLMAARVGQIINPNTLALDADISTKTLESWIYVLEASFVIFKLPSFMGSNFADRRVKIPKFYFTDVGMAAFLLKIRDIEQVARDPMVGNLFENMVVAEAFKYCHSAGRDVNLYYYRNQDNLEIDLIIEKKQHIIPIEIKSVSKYHSAFSRNIKQFEKISNDINIKNGYVVYSGETQSKKGDTKFLNFKEMKELLRK